MQLRSYNNTTHLLEDLVINLGLEPGRLRSLGVPYFEISHAECLEGRPRSANALQWNARMRVGLRWSRRFVKPHVIEIDIVEILLKKPLLGAHPADAWVLSSSLSKICCIPAAFRRSSRIAVSCSRAAALAVSFPRPASPADGASLVAAAGGAAGAAGAGTAAAALLLAPVASPASVVVVVPAAAAASAVATAGSSLVGAAVPGGGGD